MWGLTPPLLGKKPLEINIQGGRGHGTVNYTGTQLPQKLLWILIGYFETRSVQTFQPTRGYFVNHNSGYKPINRPLSYPLKPNLYQTILISLFN